MLYCSGETERTRRMAAETSRGTATETQRLPEADATVGYRHHRLEPGERILQQPRIAGKPFVQVSTAELEQLAIKLRAIQRKGGLTDK